MKTSTLVMVWLVLAAAIACGLARVNWFTWRRIAVRGVRGEAKVVELLPRNHQTVRYQYQVNGRTLGGRGQCHSPNPCFDQLQTGQTLVVYYDAKAPENSVLGDPKLMLRDESGSIVAAAVLFPTLIVYGLRCGFVLRRAE